MLAGCAGTRRSVEKHAASLMPAEIGPRETDSRKTRKRLRVRVWADAEYRRATIGWQVRVYRQFERVNEVLRGVLGLELELVEAKNWERDSRMSSLEAALFELERTDPGSDVDLVVGLVTPLPVVTSALHQLGRARLLGSHLVLRGMDDAEELAAFNRSFPKLSAEEKEWLYARRLEHKEEVVLLHELGHAFAGLHVANPTAVMTPEYDHRVSGFSPPNLDLIRIALQIKKGTAEKEALRRYLEETTFDGFIEGGRGKLLALLEGEARHLARATDADVSDDDSVRRAGGTDAAQVRPKSDLQRALDLLAEGADEAAWHLLAPLYAGEGGKEVVSATCVVTAKLGVKTASVAVESCARAARDDPDAPVPALYLAHARLEMGGPASAALAEADRRLTARGDDARPELWGFLASLYARTRAVSSAERAAKLAQGTEEGRSVLRWVEKTRERYGLTPGELSQEQETEYMARRDRIDALMARGDHDAARAAAGALSRDFPGRADADATLCSLLVADRAHREALPHCTRAASERTTDVRLLGMTAFAAFGAGRPAEAIPPLERALRVAPDKKDLWTLLASAYRVTGRGRKLAALRSRYRRRFNEPLR